MSQASTARRPAQPKASSDISLMRGAEAEGQADKKPAKPATDSAAPPAATSDNPWRNLHPSRVWPD